ncbi:MAG: HAMP domain-containing protein [Acidobacteriota bacterium]|nr:HAMP domain-containing protein [Acidobacteriota bacterium]MDH3784332.1 HAMP domain-containing protein [Acidobacteriota bacterium]
MIQTTLRRRLLWLLLQSLVLSLAVVVILAVIANSALHRETERQRIDTARIMALAIDREFSDAAQGLARLADEIGEPGRSSSGRLRQYRFHSPFRAAVSLLDSAGGVLVSDPPDYPPPPAELISAAGGVTGLYGAGDSRRPISIALVHPIRKGSDVRYLIAEMAVRDSVFSERMREMSGGEERHVALVDRTARILAVSHDAYLLQQLSHDDDIARALDGQRPTVWNAVRSPMCPDEPRPVLTALVPLEGPPWGLVLQEHRVTAYAATDWLQRGVLATGLALVLGGLLLAITLSRSIISPLNKLSAHASRMRDQDLSIPVPISGDHEIRLLGETLEAMRKRLRNSLERLSAFNESLEAEVKSRTRRLAERDAERRVLVRRLLSAGEDERCRIARELHDETAQMLTAVQLTLDEEPAPNLDKARNMLVETQREIHRVIHDLRPSLLDDLGLRAAIRSHTETYLKPGGMEVSLEIEDLPSLDPAIEISIFRVYQELATNILRHAGAEHVSIELFTRAESLVLAVEDDGVGFNAKERRAGAGITGMRERVGLVGGTMVIDSEVGMGTHVVVEVPLQT